MKRCEHCGSELKISSKGNEYCSNICWTKEPYKSEKRLEQLSWEAQVETNHDDWGNR
jgi:hypothetical protein